MTGAVGPPTLQPQGEQRVQIPSHRLEALGLGELVRSPHELDALAHGLRLHHLEKGDRDAFQATCVRDRVPVQALVSGGN